MAGHWLQAIRQHAHNLSPRRTDYVMLESTEATDRASSESPSPSWRSQLPRPRQDSLFFSLVTKLDLVRSSIGLLGLGVFILALWIFFSHHIGMFTNIVSHGASLAEGPGCNTPAVLDRLDASFWVVQVLTEQHKLVIKPRNSTYFLPCNGLRDAFFTVYIKFAPGEQRVLNDPEQIEEGLYSFKLLPPISPIKAYENVTVYARLDLDFFPGGKSGMPCGSRAIECDYKALMAQGMDWRGKEILDESGARPIYQNCKTNTPSRGLAIEEGSHSVLQPLNTSHSSIPVCRTLNPAQGVCQTSPAGYTLTSASSASPLCRILRTIPPRASQRQWLYFIGDSNTRKLVPIFAKLLGLSSSNSYTPAGAKHPTSMVYWSDSLVLTFQWFYAQQADSPERESEESILVMLLQPSVHNWPDRRHWEASGLNAFEAPSWTFISFGSHAPRVTAFGTSQMLDRVAPVILSAKAKTHLSISLTSAVDLRRIPSEYRDSKVLRNNVMLEATNQVIAQRAATWDVPVIDFFSVSRTCGPDMQIDVVHYKNEVYRIWADMIYTHVAETLQW